MSMDSVIARLQHTDTAALDAVGLAAALRDLQQVRGFVSSTELALARRADELAAAGSGVPAAEVLGRSGRCSPREAERTARRAETLTEFPSLSDQLGTGRIGTEHADAVTSAAGRLDSTDRRSLIELDTELAQQAAASTPKREPSQPSNPTNNSPASNSPRTPWSN